MLRVALTSLLARKLRFVLTGAAVVIGVSFMSGTFMLTDSINATFKSVFTQQAIGRDTIIRAKRAFKDTGVVGVDAQAVPVPSSLVDLIRQIPGVKAAEGSVQGYAQLVGRAGKPIRAEKAPMIGINWIPEPELSWSRLTVGHGPRNDEQIAIDARTFKRSGYHLGDRVTVLSTHAPRQFTLVGSLVFGGSDSLDGASVVVFDGPTAQAMVGQPGMWDEITAAGTRPGTSARALTQRISDALPPQYEAVTSASVAASIAKSVQNGIGRLPDVLLVFPAVAVFAGVFIVYNTFSILVSQRTRELALLLAIGASRYQITQLIVGEAVAVGVLASGAGLGVGALVALGLEKAFVAAGFGLPDAGLHLTARTVAVSALLGSAVTAVSAIIPARRAARTPPVAALRAADLSEPRPWRTPLIQATVVGGTGLVLMVGGLAGPPPRTALVGSGGALGFVGLAILSPRLIVPLARLVGAPARNWGGITGRLSHANAARNPRRTAATAAALMIGVTLVAVIGTVGASIKATLGVTIHDSMRADYVVSSTGGSFLSGAPVGFSSDLAARLRDRPELRAVAEIRAGFWHHGASPEYLSAVDGTVASQIINFQLSSGSVSNLAHGDVLIDTSVARSRHLKVGDRMPMEFTATGAQFLVVGGTFKPNEFVESFVVSIETYEANYPKGALDQQLLIVDNATPDTSLRVIRKLTEPYRNLEVLSPDALKAAQQRRLGTIVNLGYVLMAFSIMIALVGIVNTLGLSVIERTRELGLLRAVGMHRSQVQRMVRGESIQVCLIGATIGIVVGTALGLALVSAMSFGTKKVVSVPSFALIVVVFLAGLAGVLAAIFPARKAARIDVLDAIAVP